VSVLSAARKMLDLADGHPEPSDDFWAALDELAEEVQKLDGFDEPVAHMIAVPVDQVEANDYNPNKVATRELTLLHRSIYADGYTQPTVAVYDPERNKYVIVDGFHRWLTMKRSPDIQERTGGRLPVVVLDKSLDERMAATVRHNRARGKHSVAGMSTIVFGMLDQGRSDEDICRELGMEPEELLRLKHITGFAKLFENVEYARAWETRRQIQLRREYHERQEATNGTG
jgi:ParB-like chromosome segregation protein Spo0J